MKTIMEMARDCGINFHQAGWPELERFAALVREDEAERYKWDVHSCGPTCTKVACVATREAVLAEREACAMVCESTAWTSSIEEWRDMTKKDVASKSMLACAAAIRARGQA